MPASHWLDRSGACDAVTGQSSDARGDESRHHSRDQGSSLALVTREGGRHDYGEQGFSRKLLSIEPQPIHSLDDPRVAPYRELKDRDLVRQDGLFIAEGEHVVRRLLSSDFPVESVLLAERRLAQIAPAVPEDVPVYFTSNELMNAVIGYRFHSGVIACGRRRPLPTLDRLMESPRPRMTLVVCPQLNNAENLGSIVRLSAGFGADGLILGPRSCDPFFRQSIRVSMGAVFKLPMAQSDDLPRDLRTLKERWGVELIATVLADDAEPLASMRRPGRIGILFGSEDQGLDAETVAACDRKVTIPMHLGTDSLNVAVAAGIVVYHFMQKDAVRS